MTNAFADVVCLATALRTYDGRTGSMIHIEYINKVCVLLDIKPDPYAGNTSSLINEAFMKTNQNWYAIVAACIARTTKVKLRPHYPQSTMEIVMRRICKAVKDRQNCYIP